MNGMNISKARFWQLLKVELGSDGSEVPPKLSIKITRREEAGTDTHFDILSQGKKVASGTYTECYGAVEVY